MRQETGQSISNFYPQTSTMWEQLSDADPPLVCSKDIELFVKYWDHRKFMHFMMGLRENLKPTRVRLLMLQSRNSFLRRPVVLLITCHPLIMYWLHHLHILPLLHSLLLHE